MNVTIISHEADVDGIFSLAIGLIRYPQAKTFLTSYGTENIKILLDIIKKTVADNNDNLIILSDLGINDNYYEIILKTFKKIKNKVKIIWIDHHNWSPKIESSIKKEIELILDKSGKKCATELMYERFASKNQTALILSKMAHTSDFLENDQYLTPLPEIIKYYNSFSFKQSLLYNLAKNVSKGILWNTKMQKDYSNYCILRDDAKKHVLKKMKIQNIDKYIVVFIKSSPYLQTSIFSNEVFRKSKADIAIFYDDNKKISIRRNNDKISCSKIASFLIDGGGHHFAAGGFIKNNVHSLEDIIKEIEVCIQKALNNGN